MVFYLCRFTLHLLQGFGQFFDTFDLRIYLSPDYLNSFFAFLQPIFQFALQSADIGFRPLNLSKTPVFAQVGEATVYP